MESNLAVAGKDNADLRAADGLLGEYLERFPDGVFRQRALFWRVAPAFDLHEAPAAMLRPLYRALPRSFLLDGGVVIETWAGLPPQVPAAERP